MSQRTMFPWLLVGLALTGVAPAPPAPAVSQDVSALAKARLDAARKVFELNEDAQRRGERGHLDREHLYLWSRRLLDAQRDLSGKKDDEVPALDAHVARMKKLEGMTTQAYRSGEAGMVDVTETQFYRLEAEFWLAQAKAN